MATLAVHELTKRFGTVEAVTDLTFTAQPGRVTAFLGPNGSGKTTTLRMLCGLAEPTSGTALIDGRPYKELEQPFHTVGVLLDGGFHPGRRAKDHLRIVATAVGVGDEAIDAALNFAEIGYAAKRRVGGFSTGMKQRLGLASAMLTDPPILILDEPLNGLDPEGIQWLRHLLRKLADQGRTVLLSSHVLAETEQIADDIVIISNGRLRAAAPINELASRVTPEVRVRTPQVQEAWQLLAGDGFQLAPGATADGFSVAATSDQVGDRLSGAGIVLHELSPVEKRLESLYFELVSDPVPHQANHPEDTSPAPLTAVEPPFDRDPSPGTPGESP